MHKKYLKKLAFFISLVVYNSAYADEFAVFGKFSQPGSMGESAMFDYITANDQDEAIEKYKRKLLDAHPDYEIKILQVCTKDRPQICIKY